MRKIIFQYENYKKYLRERIQQMPQRGRGQIKKIADATKINASFLSQVLGADRNLTDDQGALISTYLGFNSLETDYFLELVRLARATTESYRKVVKRRIREMREAVGVSQEEQESQSLGERDEALFYSNWYYSAVRLAASVPSLQGIDQVSERFDLPKKLVRQIFDFLLRTRLCVDDKGLIKIGPRHLQLASDSPMIDRHLLNWRELASIGIPRSKPSDLFHSMPMAINTRTAASIRSELTTLITKVNTTVSQSTSEGLYCLNLDWFEF